MEEGIDCFMTLLGHQGNLDLVFKLNTICFKLNVVFLKLKTSLSKNECFSCLKLNVKFIFKTNAAFLKHSFFQQTLVINRPHQSSNNLAWQSLPLL